MSIDIEFSTEMEVHLECNKCGKELTGSFGEFSGGNYISVDTCGNCIEDAYDSGHSDGYSERDAEGCDCV